MNRASDHDYLGWQDSAQVMAISLTAKLLLVVSVAVGPAAGADVDNLLHNGDFSQVASDQQPTHWRGSGAVEQNVTVETGQGPGGGAALRVLVANRHAHQGAVEQRIKINPGTDYRLEGALRSSLDRLGFFQVKLYRGGRELERLSYGSSVGHWRRVSQVFHSGEADEAGILCRFLQNEEAIGQTAWFADLSLTSEPPAEAYEILAVATFSAVGVRVPYEEAPGPTARMPIRYRAEGRSDWQPGLPLFYCPPDREFRGSLVGLEPDTVYEVQCATDGRFGRLATTARTWPEDVPVGEVRFLPEGIRREPLVILDQGREDGWIVYRPAPGASAVIDAGQTVSQAVLFDQAAFVLVEGLTIRGGNRDGVQIWDSHHIRLRGCDIAQWGDPETRKEGLPAGLYVDGQGRPINYQAGVRVAGGSRQVVVERNFIHGPRGTANSWEFGHPMGPQGVILDRTGGNNVVRYNDIVGSERHWWNDAIESIPNGSVDGGPYQDTDIYGNLLAFSNDDGTELDGGQINVRFHHNWICWALCGVSHAPNVSGPSYSFRNLIACLGDERLATGSAFKMGGNLLSPGMNVILHNTFYGPGGGLRSVGYGDGPDRGAYIAYSRNNIFAGPGRGDVTNVSRDVRNDFDYDLTARGGVKLAGGGEEHAITAPPQFVDAEAGDFRLAPDSPGAGQAFLLPGFNDRHAGQRPDMGAFESGLAGARFPPRPGGMSALPLYSELRAAPGQVAEQAVSLRAPRELGSRWTATVNAPWLICRPASGATSDRVQQVRIDSAPDRAAAPLRRGAVTFRTDGGYSRTVLVTLRGLEDGSADR